METKVESDDIVTVTAPLAPLLAVKYWFPVAFICDYRVKGLELMSTFKVF